MAPTNPAPRENQNGGHKNVPTLRLGAGFSDGLGVRCWQCWRMPNYRRLLVPGGTFFFTVVTYRRQPVLCDPIVRTALRNAIATTRLKRPFTIDAWVLLPDHLHCLWTLPEGDTDYATRWAIIKRKA